MARQTSNTATTSGGIGLGSVIAAILSWSYQQDILWTIIHGMFGWLYVIYYLFGGR